jgi:hypothetical protein
LDAGIPWQMTALQSNSKQQFIASSADLDRLEAVLTASAETAVGALKSLLNSTPALDALALLKFSETGRDPLDPARALNMVEQLNQSFTYLASITAARWLLTRHPDCAPLILNLGTTPGPDIESKCGQFVAETFAATHPNSNDKLRQDIAKVRASSAPHRFVFFLSPVGARQMADTDVVTTYEGH